VDLKDWLLLYHLLLCRSWSVFLDLEVLQPLEGLLYLAVVDVFLAFRAELRSDGIEVRLEASKSLLSLIATGRWGIRIRRAQLNQVGSQFLHALGKGLSRVRKEIECRCEIVGISGLIQLLSRIANAGDKRVNCCSEIVAGIRAGRNYRDQQRT
jgi:hypothetical protein